MFFIAITLYFIFKQDVLGVYIQLFTVVLIQFWVKYGQTQTLS